MEAGHFAKIVKTLEVKGAIQMITSLHPKFILHVVAEAKWWPITTVSKYLINNDATDLCSDLWISPKTFVGIFFSPEGVNP